MTTGDKYSVFGLLKLEWIVRYKASTHEYLKFGGSEPGE
jgi:hypothetical protein